MSISTKPLFIWLPALVWLLLVTGVSVLPSVQLPQFDLFATDKLGHALIYAGLMGLCYWCLRRFLGRPPNFREGLLLFLFAAGYGALMELVQGTFLPNRAFEFDDMLANAFGAAVAWGVCHLWGRRLKSYEL